MENIKRSKKNNFFYKNYVAFQQKPHKPEECGMINSECRKKEKLAIMYTLPRNVVIQY